MQKTIVLENIELVEVKQVPYSFDGEDGSNISGISNKVKFDGGSSDSSLKVQDRVMEKMLADETLVFGTMLELTVRLKNVKGTENLGLGEVVAYKVILENKTK